MEAPVRLATSRYLTPVWIALGLALLTSSPARAQSQGFQINRYEPTVAGEWSFAVDHPWYSSMRYFAAGITLDYAHNPLVIGRVGSDGSFSQSDAVIAHQLIGNLDLAGSFLDRVNLNATIPIVFLERGTAQPNLGVGPIDGVAAADPRVGLYVRLFGQPYQGAVSLSLGVNVWIPVRAISSSVPTTTGDDGVRVLPKLMLGGLSHHVLWSLTGGFYYRPQAVLGSSSGDTAGRSMGSEIQFGAAIAYANWDRRFSIGPEALLSTVVLNGSPFAREFTSLELLLGLNYNIARQIQLGLAGGLGILHEPGTPDLRGLFRLAYAPMRKPKPADRDLDGVIDIEDLCPDTPQGPRPDAARRGCPVGDRDQDGVYDDVDLCPDTPQGEHPDKKKLGCPLTDRDSDGVFDEVDLCPDTPQGARPDPSKLGCPLTDRDGDGVYDDVDQCPDTPQGTRPDTQKPGCPLTDRDGDGVYDDVDQCPEIPQGHKPDPAKAGCPAPDRDRDTVVDFEDACPDTPGAPSPDPKKNGCPGLVEVKNGMVVIIKPVFFATNKDIILKNSFPVLQAVADALKVSIAIKKIRIEGHSDDRGKVDYNVELSGRRAKSVMAWLVANGIDAGRLEAEGFGPNKPIADNKTEKGRATNRRVDFVIIDPPQPAGVQVEPKTNIAPPASPDQSDKSAGGNKGKAPAKAPAKASAKPTPKLTPKTK